MPVPGRVEYLLNAETAYVLFSGGKDGSVALAYTKELIEQHSATPRSVALHVDRTAGLPAIEEFSPECCADVGVPLNVLRPKGRLFYSGEAIGRGLPRSEMAPMLSVSREIR